MSVTASGIGLRLNSSVLLTLVTSNQTKTAGEEKFLSKLEPWEDAVIGAYLLIIGSSTDDVQIWKAMTSDVVQCLLAVGLNGFALYIFYRKWSILNSSDYYILNLAVSDIILPCVAYPFSITSSFQHMWAFGNDGCTIYGFLGFYFGLASITILTTMSIVRYIHICQPHIDILKKEKTRLIIIGSYVYAFIWAILPVTGWGGFDAEPYGTSCTLQWHDNQSYITLMSLFCILLPSIIISSCYGLIIMHYRQRRYRIMKWTRTNSSAKKIIDQENYLIKMTFTMSFGFFIFWTPYSVVSLFTAYGRVSIIPIRLVVPSVLLAKTSIVFNPIIYFMINKRFRPFLLESLNAFNRTSSVQQ